MDPCRPEGAGTPAADTGPRQHDWVNIGVLTGVHLMAVAGVVWLTIFFSWRTLALSAAWAFCSGLAISGGYHRLFTHHTYQSAGLLKVFYLLFGAACVQNSAMKWASDHRYHHAWIDTDRDPYNIRRGFWWAHMGWILVKSPPTDFSNVADLQKDGWVRLQHRGYVALAILMSVLLPTGIAVLWGDATGGFLVSGCLRLALVWHATFSINSVAHTFGSRPYDRAISARDSMVTAWITFGEGYHNFHHTFPGDYRNGVRFWQFDPTKWLVWVAGKAGLARDLRRAPADMIARARASTAG